MSSICDIEKLCDAHFTNQNNFQSLEAVDRVSETQLQVTENLNLPVQCSRGHMAQLSLYVHKGGLKPHSFYF